MNMHSLTRSQSNLGKARVAKGQHWASNAILGVFKGDNTL